MKQKILTIIIGGLCSIVGVAQTPKYGVVDIDSVLSTIPDVQAINHKVDSIYNTAVVALEPLQKQMQTYQLQYQLMAQNDTLAMQRLQEDAQLTAQEINIIQQKTNRAINALIQQNKPYSDKLQQLIQDKGQELNLTFIMPKEKRPVYTQYGFPILLESPVYFSGEAIDITEYLINALNPPAAPKKSTTPASSKRSTKK